MTEASRLRLDHIIAYLKADPTVGAMFVDGHTDNRGEREKNLVLSKARAESVTNYLILAGIAPDRFTTRYHGERYPVASNAAAKGRAKNRRVTIRIERAASLGLVGGGAEALSDF
jgi:outer membrane protein OmpA-like peptidoglycan-associated protein